MHVVYIPQCLYGAFKAAQLTTAQLKDIDVLLNTLSPEDVAFYFAANDSELTPTPKSIADYLPNLLFGGAEDAPFTSTPGSKKTLEIFNGYKRYKNAPDMYEDGAVLSSDCTAEDLLIITHTRAESQDNSETAFYDRVIQQLLAFKPLDQVMASPILVSWLKSISTTA